MMKKILVIGGGASGMAAAAFSANPGTEVTLIEKNEKLGKKVYITGKGRCNVTNASDIGTIIQNETSNPKFLYSALYGFTNTDLMELLEKNGCPLKTERGNRVFPVSDHSSDVIRAWERILKNRSVRILLNTKVKEILAEEGSACGVLLSDGTRLESDAVIVCTGGLSYPSTGSTGDGYRFAERFGHRVTETMPSLVPFETAESWAGSLAGLSLKNVSIRLSGKKGLYFTDFGEMLFTHTGVSGPVILTASAKVGRQLKAEGTLKLEIDLKPALTEEELDARILRDFAEEMNKDYVNSLSRLLPQRLITAVVEETGIDPRKKVHDLKREERRKLVHVIKHLSLTVTGTRGFNEAVITKGGVSVKDVDSVTMESKKVKNLYFAGEVLDLDSCTGGYNLQTAWSTGVLAGRSAGGYDGI